MVIRGTVKKDRITKRLAARLTSKDIALVRHQDMDELAADMLESKNVRAVVNFGKSMTGRYPNRGPLILSEKGIPLFDVAGQGRVFDRVAEGRKAVIRDDVLEVGDTKIKLRRVTRDSIEQQMKRSRRHLARELDKFVKNTLDYARQEKGLILGHYRTPESRYSLVGREVLVVVRGQNYREDLRAIYSYITERRPVTIGVDGGADALRKVGIGVDIIIGDMDSISNEALLGGSELIVHAYPDGRAPGEERLKKLGVSYKLFKAPGTSEDIALLLAYEKGASLIVAVGTHSNMIDFLEKGRRGMASTFLVRLKVGSVLVDAKGVNKLYQAEPRLNHLLVLFAAAMVPIVVMFFASPNMIHYLRLLLISLKLS